MTVNILSPSPFMQSSASSPIPYTGNPLLLCWSDLVLFFQMSWSLIGILHPWNQWLCGRLDELYPSIPNLISLALHGFLIILQIVFLASLPILVVVPVWTAVIYVAVTLGVTWGVARVLNGSENYLESRVDLGDEARLRDDECWIYLNGVSIGKHWLRSNVDRLALTFRRPIMGVHNRTYGIIFDLIQCIIERNFCYATSDIRSAYAIIKKCLLEKRHKKVVLILHSQGGIQGGSVLDWLLSELPQETVHKLEIYTFGSAANHFNNPHRTKSLSPSRKDKAVRHIEHYGNDGDFVARWGVLHFAPIQNRYMGRVFIRSGMGHLLNQHYLNSMFPLDSNMRVMENNEFMDTKVSLSSDGAEDKAKEELLETFFNNGDGNGHVIVEDKQSPVSPTMRDKVGETCNAKLASNKRKVRDFSRLWYYRNGGSPDK